MIYIIDNGETYSDHAIWFVEADPQVFVPFWNHYQKAWPTGYFRLLGQAPIVEWVDCGTSKLSDLWSAMWPLMNDCNDVPAAQAVFDQMQPLAPPRKFGVQHRDEFVYRPDLFL